MEATRPEASARPPLSRIWSQHVVLHRAVQALDAWLEHSADRESCLETAEGLLMEIYNILPEHFALEERGGYFADVLSVAPQFARRAAELQNHHQTLIPRLELVLGEIRSYGRAGGVDRTDLVTRIQDFVELLKHHEEGETQLVRAAFRGSDRSASA